MANPPILPPPHQFPYWPMSWLSLYNQALQDFARYAQAMSGCTDPMQVMRAEGDYGLNLWRDSVQAYYDLAILPVTLAANAAAQ